MPEKHTPKIENSPERKQSAESKLASREQENRIHEKLAERAAEAVDNKENVGELSREAQQEALPAEETEVGSGAGENSSNDPSQQYVGRQLKDMTFQRTLTRIRHKLPATDKALSKVIHQPVVEAISQVGEKTVARPSGVLGGSIFAFLGSSLFLWASKHYGFRYNYLLFVIFFVGGFALGLALELLIHLARRKKLSR